MKTGIYQPFMRTYSCTVPAVIIFLKSNVPVFRKKWPLKQASSSKVIDVSKTNNHFTELYCVAVSENIHTPATEVFLVWTPTPLAIPVLIGSYFPLKIMAFKPPLPLRIPNDPLWWGYGYFLEPHSVTSAKQSRVWLYYSASCIVHVFFNFMKIIIFLLLQVEKESIVRGLNSFKTDSVHYSHLVKEASTSFLWRSTSAGVHFLFFSICLQSFSILWSILSRVPLLQ